MQPPTRCHSAVEMVTACRLGRGQEHAGNGLQLRLRVRHGRPEPEGDGSAHTPRLRTAGMPRPSCPVAWRSWRLHLIRPWKAWGCGRAVAGEAGSGWCQGRSADRALEQADEGLALLDLFLDFVAGGGDLRLCREDGAHEGEDRAADGRVEGPAQGAVSRLVGRRVRSAVVDGFLAAPARRVEYQPQDEEEACGRRESR